jgi:hypothetical protein
MRIPPIASPARLANFDQLIWVEDAGESPSEEGRLGFGQTLFNLAARQLHGEIHNAWSGTVLTVTLLFKMDSANG